MWVCENAGQLVPVDSLSSACARLESQSVCDMIVQTARDDPLTAVFRVERPIDLIQVQSRRAIDLWNLLHEMKNDDVRFHLPDHISLVFKVVQNGLLLLGTSWLSDLTSKNVQCLSDDDYDETSCFLLNTAACPLDDLTTVEPQTFKVGVLMSETALALPVERIESQLTNSRTTQLQFVMNFWVEQYTRHAALHCRRNRLRRLPVGWKTVQQSRRVLPAAFSKIKEIRLGQDQAVRKLAGARQGLPRHSGRLLQ